MLPQAVGSPPPPSGRVRRDSGRWFWELVGVLQDILIIDIVYKISLIIEGARGGGGVQQGLGFGGVVKNGCFS